MSCIKIFMLLILTGTLKFGSFLYLLLFSTWVLKLKLNQNPLKWSNCRETNMLDTFRRKHSDVMLVTLVVFASVFFRNDYFFKFFPGIYQFYIRSRLSKMMSLWITEDVHFFGLRETHWVVFVQNLEEILLASFMNGALLKIYLLDCNIWCSFKVLQSEKTSKKPGRPVWRFWRDWFWFLACSWKNLRVSVFWIAFPGERFRRGTHLCFAKFLVSEFLKI